MSLGNHLFHARKKQGLTQEAVPEHLGVSRQTISKWETDETLPDIYQAQKMAALYRVSLDELMEYDIDVKELQEIIEKTGDNLNGKVDWNKVWCKKYPILASYQTEVDVDYYAKELKKLLTLLEKQYGYCELDAMLVLKDMLAMVWKNNAAR